VSLRDLPGIVADGVRAGERWGQPGQADDVLAAHLARRLPVVEREAHDDGFLKVDVPHEDRTPERWRPRARESHRLEVDVRMCARRRLRDRRRHARCVVDFVDQLTRGGCP
jgi:hypothetical protein